jgi:FkbM family methyltransferase
MITFKPHQALEHIKPYLPTNPIIVEAGAYKGKETIKLATQLPHSTVHAFEPVPEIFEQLKANTAHLPNVHCYPIALSNTTGTTTLHLSEHPNRPGVASQGNSILAPKERLTLSPLIFPKTIQVHTITLDNWAQQNSVDHVDLLWLDLQGHELAVMQSSPKILSTVKVILTEVEFAQAYENQPQYLEVRAWLESQGFTMIGKDFPDNPTWFFGNAVFIKK